MDLSSLLSWPTIATSSLVFAVVYGVWSQYNTLKYWSNLGIKGPRPLPLVGNLLEFIYGGHAAVQMKWVAKYGKVFGIFFGSDPRLFIADPEVMIKICIKDFDAFPNHELNEFLNEYQSVFVFSSRDNDWRRKRAIMSPTFTSSKMRRMYNLIDVCADDLVELYREQLKPSEGGQMSAIINAKDTYSLYTLNSIASCCYGFKVNRAGCGGLKEASSKDELVAACLRTIQISPARLMLMICLPKPISRALGLKFGSKKNFTGLATMIERLIESRRATDKQFDDYLQLLLDARLDSELELDKADESENHHAALSGDSLKSDQKRLVEGATQGSNASAYLSNLEIVGSAMLLLGVGLETTSAFLSSCIYALAFHLEIQEKLYEELKKIVTYDETKKRFFFEYESLTSCRYLDAVMSEALRHTPVAGMTDRQASYDYHIEKYNITVPKGAIVTLGLQSLLNSSDYWSEPDKFIPERFLPENADEIVPGAYCPFGIGPRHCLGMRFSLTESKLAIAKLIINFRCFPAPKTSFPGKLKITPGFGILDNPIVKIVPRS